MGTPDPAETFVASLKRCLARPGFLDAFYDAFLGSSDEVRDKFRNTDFVRQNQVLADSLYVVANIAQGREGSPARSGLERIATRHSRAELDIRSELYETWLACLIDTARSYDPDFTPEIEGAWRSTLSVGIEHLRSRY